jgi:hypothetical protein
MCPSCRCSRRKRFSGNNWLIKHEKYVQQWEARERLESTNGARCVTSEYREYLAWLHRSTRISVHQPVSSIPIDEEGSDDDDPYDVMTRTSVQPERAPLENYMVSISFELCLHAASLEKYVVMMIMHVL